jgi:hypothetical protein
MRSVCSPGMRVRLCLMVATRAVTASGCTGESFIPLPPPVAVDVAKDNGTPATTPTVAPAEAPAAAPCVAESDAALCVRLGKNCGAVAGTDNCGEAREVASCGACRSPQVCGGGTVANVCGCPGESDAEFCRRLGKECGTVSALELCGVTRTTDCGSCSGVDTCGATAPNVCDCVPETNAAFCLRLAKSCGAFAGTDNCGQARSAASCGTCASPQTCGSGGVQNVCGEAAIDPGGGGSGKAALLAQKLRGKHNFLFGAGNDSNVSLTLGPPLDLHYQYIVGDWPTWNTDANGQGAYVTKFANDAAAHGMTPMFTLYQMADQGDGAISAIADDTFMSGYWQRVQLLFSRIAAFAKPVVVQVEPDFWGYAFQKLPRDGSGVAKVKAHVAVCADLPDTLAGMGRCFFRLRDAYAPNAVVGLHVTNWGFSMSQLLSFYTAVGAPLGDFITVEVLDRDAGCFEARIESDCQRGGSGWYWDESNTTSPNFHDHLALVKQYTTGLGVPVIWWQVPLGVPSSTSGSTGHYRDNRVHYFFGHVDELVAAGGVGAVFGSGTTPATEQTTLTSDGGQFKNAATGYYASPVALP